MNMGGVRKSGFRRIKAQIFLKCGKNKDIFNTANRARLLLRTNIEVL